ncbi:MAG: hypothetical protein WCF48_05600 [Terriglobales bacterium]
MGSVVAIDVAAAFLTTKPQIWCAVIPALIPLFTPAVIFSRSIPSNPETCKPGNAQPRN